MTIQIARWDALPGLLDEPMARSDATGTRLLKQGRFGADLIRFPPGGQVAAHTHPGDHVLVVVGGAGWVDYDGEPHRLERGWCYLVPGSVPHAIRAETELSLLSIANDHRDVASPARLDVLETL